MKTPKIMKEILSKFDIVSTQKFYLSQNFIEDDCNCDTCLYFQNQFINKQLEFFKLLTSVGVDLRKNLSSELTGMYGVLNNGVLIYCECAYRLIGDFKKLENENFEMICENYKATIYSNKLNDSSMILYLIIEVL